MNNHQLMWKMARISGENGTLSRTSFIDIPDIDSYNKKRQFLNQSKTVAERLWEEGIILKILMQIALVFGLFWLSQGVETLLPFPLPASVISLLVLLMLLGVKVIRTEHVQELSDFLLGNLGFFFVPAAVGIIQYVDTIRAHAAAFLTICGVSTVLTFAATVTVVRLTSRLLERRER